MAKRLPKHYRAPLRKRKQLVAFLMDEKWWSGRTYDNITFSYCFDVKLRRLDFSFKNLLLKMEQFKEEQKDPHWLRVAEEKFTTEFKESDVFDCVVSEACDLFTSRDARPLPDGTLIRVEIEQHGRSGGWMCLRTFNDHNLEFMREQDFENWEYHDILLFYQFLVMLHHDLSQAQMSKDLEWRASQYLEPMLEEVLTYKEEVDACIGGRHLNSLRKIIYG